MFEELIPVIKRAKKVGLFAHSTPDGDAMGSTYALKLALCGIGKTAEVFLLENPDHPAYDLVVKGEASDLEIKDCDLLIALDSGDSKRLGDYEDEFMSFPNTIAIDHHITHVPYAKSGMVVKPLSSTCELIYMLLCEMSVPVTADIANNLYIGLVTDTGNFKYSSISGDTLRIAADLIDTGINFAELSKRLFDTKSEAYYKLMSIALEKLKVICGGRAAVLYLSDKDFETAGIDEARATGIVTLPGSIEGVEVGAYIRQRSESEYKVSLRSNRYVDVARIAAAFDGGGHVRASGYRVENKTVERIIEELKEVLEKEWQD